MPEKKSTYVNEPGDIRERIRLKRQEVVLNRAMNVVQHVDMAKVQSVLDIACGTGRWCIDLKKTHPDVRITGIDNDHGILAFARVQADMEHVEVEFRQMSALESLNFPDNNFDLVNMRLIAAFTPRTAWPTLLAECKRVLRPGGILIVTEQECLFSDDDELDARVQVLCIAMHRIGYTFAHSQATSHLVIGIMVKRLLQQAGFTNVAHHAFDVDFSTGSPAHKPFFENLIAAFENGAPFLQKNGGTSMSEIEASQAYFKLFINTEKDVVGFWHFISAIGYKSC